MFKTLKSLPTKTLFPKIGNISSISKNLGSSINGVNIAGSLFSDKNASIFNGTNMKNIASSISNGDIVISSISTNLASNSTMQMLSNMFLSTDSLNLIKVTNDQFVSFQRNITPYFNYTGLSLEKPTLVLMSSFQPLFYGTGEKTPAGKFFDAQLLVRQLRSSNTIKSLEGLSNEDKKKYKDKFINSIWQLLVTSQQLLTLVNKLENLKSKFRLTDDAYTFTLEKVNELQDKDVKRLTTETRTSTIDLMEKLGYSKENSLKYSSSKIWLQTLYEFKQILRSHSLKIAGTSEQKYKNDNHPSIITRSNVKRFIPKLNSLIINKSSLDNLDVAQFNVTLSSISSIFNNMYDGYNFKDDSTKIAILMSLLSKEYRFTYGLYDSYVKHCLSEWFGYSLNDATGNSEFLDKFVGNFGGSIASFQIPRARSMSDMFIEIAYLQGRNQSAILTFERNRVEANNGVLTSGAEYYVDNIFNFENGSFELNLNNLKSLQERFNNQHNNFMAIVQGLNMLCVKPIKTPMSKTSTFNVGAIIGASTAMSNPGQPSVNEDFYNPIDLFKSIVNPIIDLKTQQSIKNSIDDKASAIFEIAHRPKNVKIKSALFLYFYTKVFYNPNIQQECIDSILKEISNSVEQKISDAILPKSLRRDKKLDYDTTVNQEQLMKSLKEGSYLINSFKDHFERFLVSLQPESIHVGLIEKQTLFSGYPVVFMAMIIFDSLLEVYSKYSTSAIVGKFPLNKSTTYFIDIKDSKKDINKVINAIDAEVLLTRQTICWIENVLSTIKNQINDVVNYSSDKSTKDTIYAITTALQNKELLKMLMTEEQINLLASNVHDLHGKLSNIGMSTGDNTIISTDADNTFNDSDQVKILDDGVITQKLLNSMNSLFNTNGLFRYPGSRDKKIFCVGIPHGFSKKLQKQSDLSANDKTFKEQQSDIININVNRINLEYPDIVFEPQKFIFELSRFPVKIDSLQPEWTTNFESYVRKFPTRDFSGSDETIFSVEYLTKIDSNSKLAFSHKSYSFLSDSQKYNIIKNQVISFFLENYIYMMTGLSVADHSFEMISNGEFSYYSQEVINLMLEKTIGYAAAYGAAASLGSTHQALARISEMQRTMTNMTDGLALSKKVLSPKKFDRTLLMITDPDDFVIDYDKTTKFEVGKQSLQNLISLGIIEKKPNGKFLFKSNDSVAGDSTIDKYFITIEGVE